jgi:hypothetical protein
LYYYFDQKGPAEKIIFTDTNIAHTNLPDVSYAPPEGLLEDENVEIVNSFTCRQRQIPQKIFLKDYNYQRPSLGISGSADVDSKGRGTDYIYGEYFATSEEGDRLASIRAEILNCRRREFIGESTIPFIEPGYTFTLSNHYRESFNQQYLVESISHEGNQMGYLLPSIAEGVPEYKHTIYYRNSFTAIPSDVQFRAEKKANRPYISGSLHAKVDAEGSGKYAELDGHGRYKVRLPFDESDDHKSGKASTWLRMMQPYANQAGGMQFPLTKGTEVLLTFIDGDPDRPVIAGAIANPETPSPVSAKNQTESVIQTGGNNKIRMEDLEGKERIIMESPTAGSWVRIGAPNDPVDLNEDGINEIDSIAAPTDGDPSHKEGIRLKTGGNLWSESNQKYGEFRVGKPDDAPVSNNANNPMTGDLLKKFGTDYNPTGMLNRHGGTAQSFDAVLQNAHVRVSALDTVNTQEGNIYDFGGYNQYKFGNRYIEYHISKKATLNRVDQLDKMEFDSATTWRREDVWVTKWFGNSYQYINGDTLKVCNGKSQNVNNGNVVQKIFKDGKKRYVSENDGETASVTTYDENGQIVKDEKSNITAESSSSATINAKATADAAINAAASAKTEINGGASTSAVLNLAASIDLGLSLGASLKFDFSAAANAKIGIGAAADFEMYWNPAASCKLKNGAFECMFPGCKLEKEAELKAKSEAIVLDSLKAQISSNEVKLVNSKIRLEARKLGLKEGYDFHL